MSFPTPLVLDPPEVATARTALDLNSGAIRVGDAGPDWGDAAIAAYMADLAVGSAPVDYRLPNRQIKIPLSLGAEGPSGFQTARAALQQKVALIQREGGWLKREAGLYADIVNVTLTLPDKYGHLGVEADVVLVLDALPDFYGDEITLPDHVETTAAELTFVETGIQGDYPGRLRIVIDNDQNADQLGLLGGIRCRNYSSASTARLAYEAEALTPLDQAGTFALAGASGGTAVRHANLGTAWTPVLSTNLLAGTPLTHSGSYRIWVRAGTTSAPPPSLRLVWGVGDLVFPVENDAAAIPATSPSGPTKLYTVDLGEVRLDPAAAGTHRWQGIIQGQGLAGISNDVSIDRIWLVPVDEGAVKLQTPATPADPLGLNTVSGRDGFDQSAGALSGKTASVGGNWTRSGDPDDFAVETGGATAQRTATSDVSPFSGACVETLGSSSLAAVMVQADVKASVAGVAGVALGVVARFIDINNYLALTVLPSGTLGTAELQPLIVIGGASSGLAQSVTLPFPWVAGNFYTVRLMVDAAGRYFCWAWPISSARSSTPQIVDFDSRLATGGTLATGKFGIVDWWSSATAGTRNYDNFYANPFVPDAVLYANHSAQIGTDGNLRQDSAGAAYGPVSISGGDLLRIPPSGAEGRSVEFLLKPSRGDLADIPDGGIDDISARVFYRPTWLFRPVSAST